MNLFRVSVLLALLSGLSGCTVDKAGCDPAAMRNADFFSRLSCDVSGSYDARAQDQQLELQQAQQNRAALQQALLELEAEQRQVSQGLVLEKARRDRLVKSINAHLSQAQALSTQNAALQQQVQKARDELQKFQALPSQASAQQQAARLKQVQQEVDALRAMLP